MNPAPLVRFERWFAAPLRLLRALDRGDGAFAAMSVSFSLFERYVKSTLKREGIKASPDAFFERSVKILNVDRELFEKFWGMYRDGIQHYLQPKTFESNGVKYGWRISSDFDAKPAYLVNESTKRIIAIDPWKWIDVVLGLYEADPGILSTMESHALGEIRDDEEG